MVQILGKDVRENCVLINNVNRTDWSTVAGMKVILLKSKCAPVRFERTGIISHHILYDTMFNSWPLYYIDVLNAQQLTRGFRFFITTTNRSI